MNCTDLKEKFDDYVDGTLASAEAEQLRQHARSCDACQQLIDREQKLRSALSEYADSSIAIPGADFFDQALVTAARRGIRQQHKRSWMTGFGSAVAAGLAIWVLSGVLFNAPDGVVVDPAMPTITMALEEPRTINLVFSSATVLDDATLTVLLPEGVELAGFEGQREITWVTSLKEGKNLLPLRLIATVPTEGVLLATLKHGEDDRVFRLRVEVS
jgi:anti-sigma factor RsiW